MTRTVEEQSLTVALRALADRAPGTDISDVAAAQGRRRLRRRRAAVAGVAIAGLLVIVPVTLHTLDKPTPTAPPAASSPPPLGADLTSTVRLNCRDSSGNDHGVNSGTPDGGSARAGAPLDQARKWAAGSGFSGRYPATQPTEARQQGAALVVFKDRGGVPRAVLQYDGSDGRWLLTRLQYC